MSNGAEYHTLSRGRERSTLLTLAAVQFTHIVDFMIMMPLGEQLMHVFGISPAQFTQLVAAYGLAAAVSGFAGGFILDRFHRKRALLSLYFGFGLATFACGLAPSYGLLMAARVAAGAFGGVASSMVIAMVGDIIPPERRGRGMSVVAAAFPVASVLGVPAGLTLAGHYNWHAPFFLLGACAGVNLLVALAVLPALPTGMRDHQPLRQMREIVTHRIHLRAFAVGAVLVIAGGLIIPLLASTFVANVGLDEASQLPRAYMVGGVATALSTPLIGWLSDRMDRLHLLAIMSTAAVVVVLFITRLGPSSTLRASLMMALFMVTMSGRFAPAMTMITNAVAARYRGGFMSVNAALQQAASGLASVAAGWFITREASGHLSGFPVLGYVASFFFALTVFLALQLRAAAPHVSKPGHHGGPVAEPEPLEVLP